MKDYYSILGVPIDADTSLIKSVYKSLCKIYHPDTYVGNKTYADKKIKEINEAYEHLKNPEKRKNMILSFKIIILNIQKIIHIITKKIMKMILKNQLNPTGKF